VPAKIATRPADTASYAKGHTMLDVREAINTLNAYSMTIASKTRLCENLSNRGAPEEAKKAIEEFITALEAETKESIIIAILVMEEVTRHAEQMVAGFTGELAELITALNRNNEATDEASKFTLAHQEKNKPQDPTENPIAKAIKEFREKHRLQPH